MQVSIENIGTLIAFLLPGLVAVAGVSGFSPIVRRWLGVERDDGPTIGAALLLGLAAFGAGLLLDAVRIQTIDEIHHHTGIAPPDWSFDRLTDKNFPQFQAVIENHFRYHQFYGNLFLAIVLAYPAWKIAARSPAWPPRWREAWILVLLVITWIASRTELTACYQAMTELMSKSTP